MSDAAGVQLSNTQLPMTGRQSRVMWRGEMAGGYDARMLGRLQFSLRYLLAEFLLFALAMGLTRVVLFSSDVLTLISLNVPPFIAVFAKLLLLLVTAACWGAAIGGLFGRMKSGARLAFYAALLLEVFMVVSSFY